MGIIYNPSRAALPRANLYIGMASLAMAIPVQGIGVVNLALAVRTTVHRPFRPRFLVLPLAASG